MEAQAVQLIQDTAIIAAAKSLATHIPTVALPAGVKVQSIEQYQLNRCRFRGAMTTHSLPDFTTYVTTQVSANIVGFVDGEAMSCKIYFNLGTEAEPGHGDFTATLTLAKTAAFVALEYAASRALAQKDLSDWIEDWAPNLTAIAADGEPIDLRKAAGAIRSITIEQARNSEHTVSDLSQSKSAMDRIEAKSSEGLPSDFLFKVRPFEGLAERVIQLRVAVLTGGDKPMLRLRWIGEAQLREDLAQEFKSVVQIQVGEKATLTVGNFTLA